MRRRGRLRAWRRARRRRWTVRAIHARGVSATRQLKRNAHQLVHAVQRVDGLRRAAVEEERKRVRSTHHGATGRKAAVSQAEAIPRNAVFGMAERCQKVEIRLAVDGAGLRRGDGAAVRRVEASAHDVHLHARKRRRLGVPRHMAERFRAVRNVRPRRQGDETAAVAGGLQSFCIGPQQAVVESGGIQRARRKVRLQRVHAARAGG